MVFEGRGFLILVVFSPMPMQTDLMEGVEDHHPQSAEYIVAKVTTLF
jgi:hypothetical protein